MYITFRFLKLKITKKKKPIRPFEFIDWCNCCFLKSTLATKNVSNFDRLDVINIGDWTL